MFRRPGIELLNLHHIGNVKGAFAFDNCPLGVLLAFAHVLFDHARAFHDHARLFRRHTNNAATLAFISPGNDDHFVTFFHMKTLHSLIFLSISPGSRQLK